MSEPLPGKQSNNRAELQAAVKALMTVRDRKMGPVQIRTDSGYVKQGITNWIKNWKRNGWKTAVGIGEVSMKHTEGHARAVKM